MKELLDFYRLYLASVQSLHNLQDQLDRHCMSNKAGDRHFHATYTVLQAEIDKALALVQQLEKDIKELEDGRIG